MITPSECGAKRNSAIQCPPSCPFNPFGQAADDAWEALLDRWREKVIAYARDHFGEARFDRLVAEGVIHRGGEYLESESGIQHALHFGMRTERDARGRTAWESWEAQDWAGLNNDERVMAKAQRALFPTVLEVQQVLDDRFVDCVDVLAAEPKTYRIFNPRLAATALRYDRKLCQVVPYPGSHRVHGFTFTIAWANWHAWKANIDQFFAQDREKQPDLVLPDWLLRHFAECAEGIFQLDEAHRRQEIEKIDPYLCTAHYTIVGDRARIEEILAQGPDFVREDPQEDMLEPAPLAFFSWRRRGESAAFEEPTPEGSEPQGESEEDDLLGYVRVYEDYATVTTVKKRRFAFLKERVKTLFGELLSFQDETFVNLLEERAKQVESEQDLNAAFSKVYGESDPPPAEDGPGLAGTEVARPPDKATESADGSAPPPKEEPQAAPEPRTAEEVPLTEEQSRRLTQQAFRARYRQFLEEPLEFLDNQSPRAAARDDSLRPKLIEFMKIQINATERQSRDEGLPVNLDWVLDELGLEELKSVDHQTAERDG